jgi:cation:H+ antiporter
MIHAIFLLIVGIIALYYGADFLIKGAGKIALLFGLSPLFIGLTIVALGTSLPELFVSMTAAFEGKAALSLGNVVGSNIANIGLVLGVGAIIAKKGLAVKEQLLRFEMPLLLFYSILFFIFCLHGKLNFYHGIVMLFLLGFFLIASYKKSPKEFSDSDEMDEIKKNTGNPAVLIVQILLGGIALDYGADFTVQGAVVIAKVFHLSDAIIGASIVAIGTSLPELFTTIISLIKGNSDIGVGNALGSNILNMFGIMGAVTTITPVVVEKSVLYFFAIIDKSNFSACILAFCLNFSISFNTKSILSNTLDTNSSSYKKGS